MSIAADIIASEEGFELKPYYDHLGFPTVGYGRLLGPKDTPLSVYSGPIYEPAERAWLNCHIEKVIERISGSPICNAYQNCNDVQKAVLISMAYQMGVNGLSKFKKTLKFLEDGIFDAAALEMIDSNWADQTPERAERHADMIFNGELLERYT